MAVFNGTEYVLGADPEVFAFDREQQAYVGPGIHGLVPGSKYMPFLLPDDIGAVQVDGMAVEFNSPPCDTPLAFEKAIATVINFIKSNLPPVIELHFKPTVYFSEAEMSIQRPEDLLLGCEPDYNGWTLRQNPRPLAPALMRSAGGHIHIGWKAPSAPMDTSAHFERCATLARYMDYFVGEASLGWDDDKERRSIYGAPGSFRPKAYGMEYRSLSCVWAGDPSLRIRAAELTFEAVRAFEGKSTVINNYTPTFGG